MATWVSFLDLKSGVAFDVNVADENVAALRTVPDSVLTPLGIATGLGTYIEYDSGLKIAVRGNLATTAAAFAGGGVAPSKAVYVDTAGNDSTGQRGSAAFPFLTMSAALAVCQSGDELLVSPGNYTGTLNHASLPAIANLTIRGSGEFAGDTVVSGANGEDVITLNAANRSIFFDNIQIAGLTTGRAVVGTGATAAGAWLSTGNGLVFQDCVLSSAASDSLVLTDANLALIRDTTLGSAVFTTCSSVTYQTSAGGATTWTFDNTDANKPALGASTGLTVNAGSSLSSVTLGGQARINARDGSILGALTALNLSVAAGPVSPSIVISGTVGAVDFNTTTAALPSAALGAYNVKFDGATCTGATMTFRVASGATNQPISMVGITVPQACTFTSDALCQLNMRGAALTSPTYTSANTGALGVGTLVPPYLIMSNIDIAAGGAIATNFTGGFTATTAPSAVVSQTNTGGAALAASCSTTQITITSTAQAGNKAQAYITWAA